MIEPTHPLDFYQGTLGDGTSVQGCARSVYQNGYLNVEIKLTQDYTIRFRLVPNDIWASNDLGTKALQPTLLVAPIATVGRVVAYLSQLDASIVLTDPLKPTFCIRYLIPASIFHTMTEQAVKSVLGGKEPGHRDGRVYDLLIVKFKRKS